jgi:hypothetical protein
VKLYVCWGTFQVPGMREHPCRLAFEALREAGHDPEVVKAYGYGPLPDMTRGRREVKRLSGSSWVPLLVTGDGEVVAGSERIIAWAAAHPVGTRASAA